MSNGALKDRKRQQQSQSLFVHPAAAWQEKYLLLHHQTTEQLFSSGCKAPEVFIFMMTLYSFAFYGELQIVFHDIVLCYIIKHS